MADKSCCCRSSVVVVVVEEEEEGVLAENASLQAEVAGSIVA